CESSSSTAVYRKTCFTGSDTIQHRSRRYSPQHLCNNVRHQLLFVKTPSDHQAKGNSRIEMTSRNVPNGISHHQYCQAKGQSHSCETDTKIRYPSRKNCASAPAEHKPEGTKKFSKITFHIIMVYCNQF